RGVPETIDLVVHGGDHRRMAMPEVGDSDAAAEVQHVAAVDRMQVRALGALEDEVRVAVICAGNQFGVALTPRRRVSGRQHPAHAPDVARAGPDEDGAAFRTPTFPRARKPPNMIAIPAASYAPRISRSPMPMFFAAVKPAAMTSAPPVSSTLQITRSIPAWSRMKRYADHADPPTSTRVPMMLRNTTPMKSSDPCWIASPSTPLAVVSLAASTGITAASTARTMVIAASTIADVQATRRGARRKIVPSAR